MTVSPGNVRHQPRQRMGLEEVPGGTLADLGLGAIEGEGKRVTGRGGGNMWVTFRPCNL